MQPPKFAVPPQLRQSSAPNFHRLTPSALQWQMMRLPIQIDRAKNIRDQIYHMRIFPFLTGILLWSGAVLTAHADVSIAPIFGNSMVLQRDQPVPVWGKALPGESLTVTLGEQKLTTTADSAGQWKVTLPAMPANAAPQSLTIAGGGPPTVLTNVLIGDVWLCAGQSQMGLELRKDRDAETIIASAQSPNIRVFTVTATASTNQGYLINPTQKSQHYALTPQATCEGSWQTCTPATVRDWSAVSYSFARNLHDRLHVPIGIIVASYGATAIEAWISLEGLKAIPSYRERALAFAEIVRTYLADTNSFPGSLAAEAARLNEHNLVWFQQLDTEEPGLKNNWMAPTFDVSQWGRITLPVTTANNPLGEKPAAAWFRKDVVIPSDWVGKDLELHLGIIDSADESYVNGHRMGRTWFDTDHYWQVSRVYPVPAGEVTSTNVAVVLRLVKLADPMGLFGPAAEMKLTLKSATNSAVALDGVWRHCRSYVPDPGHQPRTAPLLNRAPGVHYGHPGVQYNGQIHSLIPFGIRGVIWYQGGSNAPFYTDYRSLLPGLIADWRKRWGLGSLPFGIVAIPDYEQPQTKPVERRGRHLIREAQAMALTVTNTFLATAVGTGEAADVHPKRMQELGRRLALGALGSVYGLREKPYFGPLYKTMSIEGAKIRLHFDFAAGLHAQGEPPVGFAIAGDDRAFYFANAKIEGETVLVWSDNVPKPVAVRYAWASYPICNLSNSEELPMFQFHTDDWDPSQLVIPTNTIVTIPTGWTPR